MVALDVSLLSNNQPTKRPNHGPEKGTSCKHAHHRPMFLIAASSHNTAHHLSPRTYRNERIPPQETAHSQVHQTRLLLPVEEKFHACSCPLNQNPQPPSTPPITPSNNPTSVRPSSPMTVKKHKYQSIERWSSSFPIPIVRIRHREYPIPARVIISASTGGPRPRPGRSAIPPGLPRRSGPPPAAPAGCSPRSTAS